MTIILIGLYFYIKNNFICSNMIKEKRYKKSKTILGEGSYKTVTKAVDEEEGKEVAYNEVKIKYYENETKKASAFSKEIALLKTINHPNIIRILDYWFTDDDFIFITEFMTGGSLKDYIINNGALNIKLIKKWGKQIIQGLNYLHTLNPPIIHRDIKNDNIFINSVTGEIKIGDLGLAREKKHKRYTIVGTPHFMAREMFEGEGYTEKIDVYAFGMCLIEMATGKTPYLEYKNTTDIYKSVLQGVPPKSLSNVEDACLKNLIMGCIIPSNVRLTSAKAMEHHFFENETCTGDCANEPAYTRLPVKDMELSLISISNKIVSFQVLLVESMRFIKFDYDLEKDTVEKVASELINEKIIENEFVEGFSNLLAAGIKTALIKINNEEHRDKKVEDIVNSIISDKSNVEFGTGTLEEMEKIEEEMKLMKIKEDFKTTENETKQIQRSISGEKLISKKEEAIKNMNSEIEALDSLVYTDEFSKSLKFKNDSKKFDDEYVENIYLQFPSVRKDEDVASSTSSIPQKFPETFETVKSPEPIEFGKKSEPKEDTTDKNDFTINYESYKEKYKNNCSIQQYAADVALITKRNEETSKSWAKVLKDEDISSVFDLKLIVYEDWEKLPLTVFSCRAMQNVLYGADGIPLREKQLPFNPKFKDYENSMTIKEFLDDVCDLIGRKELVSSWENKLLAQDIQTVGELKILHQEDWNRIDLSVFSYRILKNIIFRKGKISI